MPACLLRPLRRRPDRRAVNAFAQFGAHARHDRRAAMPDGHRGIDDYADVDWPGIARWRFGRPRGIEQAVEKRSDGLDVGEQTGHGLTGVTRITFKKGADQPDRKRLGLDSPTNLLAKLRWEIVQLGLPVNEEAVASYRAFNCAVTAWSICDWAWNAAAPGVRERLRAESPNPNANGSEPLASLLRDQSRELAICQQLANGSKHFVLDKHNDEAVSSFRTASVSFYLSDDGKGRSVPTFGVFIEDGDRTYSALGLFSRAHEYWHDFFKRYGVG